MTMILIPEKFREKVRDLPIENKEVEEINWRPAEYRSTRAKFKFNIYSKRDGSIARYYIGVKEPNFLWQELKNLPQGITFEESKTKEFIYCRLLKHGVPERGAMIKLPRPKTGA